MSEVQPLPEAQLGQYRHYKGGRYEVVGVARHSESLEPMVVYRPLYGQSGLWVRPFSMFFESVVPEGRAQPRFAHIGPSSAALSEGELVRTVERMESALWRQAAPEVAELMGLYRGLVRRFEQDLGANSRDSWLARATALMLVQAVHRKHGAA